MKPSLIKTQINKISVRSVYIKISLLPWQQDRPEEGDRKFLRNIAMRSYLNEKVAGPV
jgi:hypothetical protein